MAEGVEAYFGKLEGEVHAVALALRHLLDETVPQAEVKLAWGFPCWLKGPSDRVASIIAHTNRCNLQLWQGATLAKTFPARIEGTGKDLRHVKVYRPSEVDAELKRIIETAAALPRHVVR